MSHKSSLILLLAMLIALTSANAITNSLQPSKTTAGWTSTCRTSRTTTPPSRKSNPCGTCYADLIRMSTWQWSRWIFPHTVGKVFVVIDDSTNSTRTSTSLETVAITAGSQTLSATDWMKNGTFSMASRRTVPMTRVIDGSTTLTYPSRLVRIDATELSWTGEIAISKGNNNSHCLAAGTAATFTMTTPLPSLAPQALDPQDHMGEFYKAHDFAGGFIGADAVGTYFGPTASMIYSSCTGAGVLPASWAKSALFLLETSTQRINSQAKASSTSLGSISEAPLSPVAMSERVQTITKPWSSISQVKDATTLISATAANSLETFHITFPSTHPGTVASWADAAPDLLTTPVVSSGQDANADPMTATVDGDAVASAVASILGMTKTKEEFQAHGETAALDEPSAAMSMEASTQTSLSSNVQDQQLTDSTHIPSSSVEEVTPTQDSFSEPHISTSEVLPALFTSQTLDDQASQVSSTYSPSRGPGASNLLALGSGHSDHVQQSSYPAAQSTGTSAGSSKTVSKLGSTVTPNETTDDSDPPSALQPSTSAETSNGVQTASGSSSAPQSSASSSTSTTEGDTRTTDTSTPQPSSTEPSSPLIQPNLSPTSRISLDVVVPLIVALFLAIIWSAC